MSESLAREKLSTIDDLVHAVAGIAHVEKPYLETRVSIRKFEIAKEPFDKELAEAKAKKNMWENDLKALDHWTLQWFMHWITCEVASERERCNKGLKKAGELIQDAQAKVDSVNEKIHDAEVPNEKNSVDYRSLQNYREELTELLDSIFGDSDFPTEKEAKLQRDEAKERLDKITEDFANVDKARELIKKADMSLLEAIVDLRQSNDNKDLAAGQVYFPQEAYEALKELRENHPAVPGILPPQEYEKKADDTGAYYSPMQRYLWEVRNQLSKLVEWCDDRVLENMDKEAEETIAFGAKTDEWNLERRRIVKEVILS